MAYTPIEIIAVLFSLLVIIKLIVISINPKAWMDQVAKPIYKNPVTSGTIMAVLAVVFFYYLLAELTVTQIYAAIAFMAMLTGVSFCHYSKEMLPWADKVIKKPFSGTMWLLILVWLVISVWVLLEVFGYA